MFEEFIQRKYEEYFNELQFEDGKIYFRAIEQSDLPPFIINFFDCSISRKKLPIEKEEAEQLLRNAIVFNTNYVIRPKETILKFLFGSADARPSEYVRERLGYFQFYSYYIRAIAEVIQIHSPPIISFAQTKQLLERINENILKEITEEDSSDAHRLNLIKLLYHFFIDLTENNPVNIKLPKTILSAFFQDKGFEEIRKKADNFFKEDIFIQEAVQLMHEKAAAEQPEAAEEFMNKELLESEQTDIEMDKIKGTAEQGVQPAGNEKIQDSDIYSHELMAPPEPGPEYAAPPVTDIELKEKTIEKLFCEVNYRKNIINKLFITNETQFKEFVFDLLEINNWDSASDKIDNFFEQNKIDYLSEEAVKFVDIMNDYFDQNAEAIKVR